MTKAVERVVPRCTRVVALGDDGVPLRCRRWASRWDTHSCDEHAAWDGYDVLTDPRRLTDMMIARIVDSWTDARDTR